MRKKALVHYLNQWVLSAEFWIYNRKCAGVYLNTTSRKHNQENCLRLKRLEKVVSWGWKNKTNWRHTCVRIKHLPMPFHNAKKKEKDRNSLKKHCSVIWMTKPPLRYWVYKKTLGQPSGPHCCGKLRYTEWKYLKSPPINDTLLRWNYISKRSISHAGNRTRAAAVRATNPNH